MTNKGKTEKQLNKDGVNLDETGKPKNGPLKKENTKDELQQQQAFLESIYNGVDVAIFVFDVTEDGDFRFVGLNPRHEEISGMKSDDIKGKTLTDLAPFIPEEAIKEIRARYERCVRAGKTIEYEEMIPMGGKDIWWLTRLNPLKDESSKIYRIIGTATPMTERKEMEMALRESEEKFRVLINDINDGVINADAQGVITFTNPRLVNIYGYDDASELIGRSILDFIVEDEKPYVMKLYGNSMRTGEFPEVVESRVKGKNGEVRNIEVKPVPIFENGNIVGSTSIVRDITERKLAEEELRKHKEHLEELVEQRSAELKASEFRFRTIFENVPVSIWEEDWVEVYDLIAEIKQKGVTDYEEYFNTHPDFVQKALKAVKVTDVNDRTLEMFGAKDKPEMLSSLETVFSTEDTLPGFISELIALAQGKYFFETEMALRKVSKEKIIVHLTMIFPEKNAPFNRVLVSLMDITEQKKTEESLKNRTEVLRKTNNELKKEIAERKVAQRQLKKSEEKFRNLMESAPIGIAITSPEGKIIETNNMILKIFGFESKKKFMQDAASKRYMNPEDRKRFIDILKKEGLVRDYEVKFKRKNGTAFWGSITSIVQTTESGQNFIINTFEDITHRKLAEEALKQKTEELARSNEELQQFAYVASHDLQEPLRKVANFSELLADRYQGKLDDKADKFIGYIVDGANRMRTLINDLLAYSRVGTRGNPMELTETTKIVQQVLSDLSAAINESGTRISVDTLPKVYADSSQIHQLFQNLISNAIKYRGKEKPKIHIGAEQRNGEWVFSIRDNGIGIDPEFNDRIFIIFQRLHSIAEYSGTGIGLALCRKIVQRHGGRIWVESESGKGSAFYFTLPDK